MTNKLPLSGFKIVVTRPRDQSAPLARRIEQQGGIAVLCPLLDISALQDTTVLQEKLSHLADFDLAIFVSPNAVHYGIEAIRKAGGLPPGLKIAAIGQGSATALRDLGIRDVIAPAERYDSEGLLAVAELQNVAGWRVMVLRGESGRELLADTLRARGATVEHVACYRRSKSAMNPQWLLATAPDAISVTSSEALDHLWQILDDKVRRTICGTMLFVPHPRIAERAVQQGWLDVRLTGSGDDGLLAALQAEAERAGKT
jgi:uroporphyrinogen-III synthase